MPHTAARPNGNRTQRRIPAGGIACWALVFLAVLTCGAAPLPDAPLSPPAGNEPASPQAEAAVQQYMTGPSVFIENAGQWADTSVKFALDGMGANVGLTDKGPRFQLFRANPGLTPESKSGRSDPSGSSDPADLPEPVPSEMHEFALVFDGAAAVSPVGRGQSERKFNYLVGDASTHREGVGSFDAVWYESLYPGVSLELTGSRTGIKYNFHVAPGADPTSIRLRYEDIQGLRLTPDGALEIRVKEGWAPLTDGAPYLYQEANGEKKTVAGGFVLVDDHSYGFAVTGAYDTTLPLVIDPAVAWGTYLGGTGDDYGYGIAVDSAGNCYATGYTYSAGWVSGGWNTTYGGGDGDCFVVKLSSAGAHLWSTYLGGGGWNCGYGIAVDSAGNCYATGQTWSEGWVSGGWDTTPNGGPDCFVVKLSSAGAHLWSTYLGGTGHDEGQGIAVDATGNCYATGETYSAGWVSGGWDTSFGGGDVNDGFVVKLSTAGAHLWSTYLGGGDWDRGSGIVVDSAGNCYATGYTNSAGWVSGGWDTTLGGDRDAYVVKLSTAGAHLWSTYLGGTDTDYGNGIAADATGNCYATGETYSAGWVSGGWDTSFGGGDVNDGFVVKLSAAGAHLWSTYLGGTDNDFGNGIAVDSAGNCYATGSTDSAGWVNGGWDATRNSSAPDGFLVKLSTAGAHLWSTYLGGTSNDYGYGIAVDATGTNTWVTGYTFSAGWVSGGWDTTHDGDYDGFVFKATGPNDTGSLRVTLGPAGAISAGAQWRPVASPTWYNSGDTVTGLAAGEWVVEFKDMYGWAPPEMQTVSVPVGGTATVTGVYTAVSVDVSWSTYLGGTGGDTGYGIAVDASGNCYATGMTYSAGWVSGGWNTTYNGGSGTSTDGFVVKLSSTGAHLWSTYLGGTGTDYGQGIAVDSSGNCYATGLTQSSGWVSGGWNASFGGSNDGFVVKLSAAGAHLWSTYLGGTDNDFGYGIAVDSAGNCCATGPTASAGWVSGGWNTTRGGDYDYDGFVVKLSSAGAHLWSTYLGGTSEDISYGIAVDSAGNCYATGTTDSAGWVSGGWDTSYDGHDVAQYGDGFVVKLSTAGAHLWSTYLGGTSEDISYGIAVDSAGNCYATGDTGSAGWVSGGWNASFGGSKDGFVVKLSAAGEHLWSTYLGGTDYDTGFGIAVDATGNCYATGYTGSAGWVSGGWQTAHGGWYDGFVVKLSTAGAHLWSTYLGGTCYDVGFGIAVDATGTNTWVTGETESVGWVSGGWDTTYNGGGFDAFVAKIVDNSIPSVPSAPSNPGATAIGLDTITWTWQDNSGNETGFKVYDDPGSGPPVTLQTTTAADVEAWQHNGLSANTQHAFQAAATNGNGDSTKTTNYTAWTLIEAVSGLSFSGVTGSVIGVGPANAPSNLTSGASGLYYANTTAGTDSGWVQTAAPWASGGLSPNTQYTFSGRSRNGDSVSTAPATASKWTLAAQPLAPSVTNATQHTLDVALTAGDGNPAGTEYAIRVDSGLPGNVWVQADGTLGAAPVYRTMPAWGAVTVTGLSGGTFYGVFSVARNGEGIDSAIGLAGYGQTLEDVPPTGTVVINGGAAYTNTTAAALTLSATDGGSGVAQMRFSNDNVSWSGWEAYATSKAWTLSSGEGLKKVYAQFRDGVGNVSAGTISDGITLDTVAPGIGNIAAIPAEAGEDETVTLTFDVSEPLDAPPEVTVNSHAAVRDTEKAGYVYLYTVLGPEQDPLGPAYIEISGVDLAGNLGAAANSSALTIIEARYVPALSASMLALLAALTAAGGAAALRRRK